MNKTLWKTNVGKQRENGRFYRNLYISTSICRYEVV